MLLPASEAVLPKVGSCTFMEYFCDGLKCNTLFYQRLQKDPKGDCRFGFYWNYNKILRKMSGKVMLMVKIGEMNVKVDTVIKLGI